LEARCETDWGLAVVPHVATMIDYKHLFKPAVAVHSVSAISTYCFKKLNAKVNVINCEENGIPVV
tara:strand:+ start:2297 stop:2491 length:195 start_codon:yes stop_codon:yes gene_type:complete